MSKDFLLEIGTEEIPAKFIPGAMAQLEELAHKRLQEMRLDFAEVNSYATPRRLALLVKELAEKQKDLNTEVKGPAVKAAYSPDGKPTKAAEGFARSQGVSVDSLFTQEVNGVPYVFAQKSETGKDCKSLLPGLCRDLITSLHFPKPMRWGDLDFRFARPIRWLVAMYGEEILEFEFVRLKAGRVSQGHRTLAQEPIVLQEPAEYKDKLRQGYVLVDSKERKINVWHQIQALAGKAGGVVAEDEELLDEVIHIVEYPTALLGEVPARYMELPEAVITTPMREHQRYFPVRSAAGKLLPYFITVRNGDETALEKVKAGNEKVLKARLEDAAFYYREDSKVPLSDFVRKLEKIVYHEKLGTVRARVERLRSLSGFIVRSLGLGTEKQELVDRTAFLAKADLATLMVYDFPELQGIMGAEYAKLSQESPEVCQGIVEHYQPRFAGDALPESLAGRIVSIADKLDAIVGAFGIGIQPTGSQDPYALRRQAQGIVGILLKAEWDLSLAQLVSESHRLFGEQGVQILPLNEILPLLQDFFQQRLRYILQDQGLRYDTVDAVLAQGSDKLFRTAQKALVLHAKRDDSGFAEYVQAYVRCYNLSKKAELKGFDEKVLEDPAEIKLAEELFLRRERFDNLLEAAEYEQAYKVAAELVPSIEKLFLAVMIMVEDENLRAARLALLGQCVEMLGCLGDLSLLSA
ncbi:glycine--tRNA ligase subunit beta [Paradesulfitobacterium ferrireducens]|uniref:glycine--tRNA ligase subunit beta n=1 Tax=Paradesulfitobacterium ferrireducens TaxID=2816476 RepID=UPI001A8F439C|nr:glycine--tRNA ligase subunit beta [Paradesulfitobacterium ferrireducens]